MRSPLLKKAQKKLPHKRTREATYFLRSLLEANFPSFFSEFDDSCPSMVLKKAKWNILKAYNDGSRVSFLWYPEFDSAEEPMLCEAITLNLSTGEHRSMSWKKGPVFHKKELLMRKQNPFTTKELRSLRRELHDAKDSPEQRAAFAFMVLDNDFAIGMVEHHFPGFAEWLPRQVKANHLFYEKDLKNRSKDLPRNLQGLYLEDAKINRSNLKGADLEGADLGRANGRQVNLQNANLKRANLQKVDFRGADLRRANLSDSNLSNAFMKSIKLSNANLSGANASHVNFSDANLSNADMTRTDLRHTNFHKADMLGANLSGAMLNNANLFRANLEGALYSESTQFPDGFDPVSEGMLLLEERQSNPVSPQALAKVRELLLNWVDSPSNRSALLNATILKDDPSEGFLIGYADAHVEGFTDWIVKQSRIQQALDDHALFLRNMDGTEGSPFELKDLAGADLRGANLSVALLDGADLTGADLTGATLGNLQAKGTNFENAILKKTDLSFSNLERANLSGADLSMANLEGANLEDSTLRGSILDEANMDSTILNGANLTGASLKNAALMSAELVKADLENATLRGADLTGADLSLSFIFGADFRETVLDGTDFFGAEYDEETETPPDFDQIL